jgi:hypothetical protein
MTSFAFPSGGRARQRQLLGSTFISVGRVIVIGTHASMSRSHPARVPCPLDLHLLRSALYSSRFRRRRCWRRACGAERRGVARASPPSHRAAQQRPSSPRRSTTAAVAAAVQWQQHAAPSGAALAVHPDAPLLPPPGPPPTRPPPPTPPTPRRHSRHRHRHRCFRRHRCCCRGRHRRPIHRAISGRGSGGPRALPRPRRTVAPHCAVPPPGDGGPDESSDDPDESSGAQRAAMKSTQSFSSVIWRVRPVGSDNPRVSI